MKSKKWCFAIALLMFTTGCNKVSEQQLSPLRGIAWFTEMEEVKNVLSDMELIAERESGEGTQKQYLLDYSGANLFETDCDFTICCTSQGFAGVNYHDIEHVKTYHQWLTQLEDIYGLPTEKGNGMASWYQNPVGKNTAVYLFNLEEGIQVSFMRSVIPLINPMKNSRTNKTGSFHSNSELRTL